MIHSDAILKPIRTHQQSIKGHDPERPHRKHLPNAMGIWPLRDANLPLSPTKLLWPRRRVLRDCYEWHSIANSFYRKSGQPIAAMKRFQTVAIRYRKSTAPDHSTLTVLPCHLVSSETTPMGGSILLGLSGPYQFHLKGNTSSHIFCRTAIKDAIARDRDNDSLFVVPCIFG